MRAPLKTTLAAAAIGTAMAASVAGSAFATTGSTTGTSGPTPTLAPNHPVAATVCQDKITDRLNELGRLQTRISDATSKGHLTSADAAALTGLLGPAQTGLQKLQSVISPTDPNLTADCKSIVDDYRIYALRAPQVHLTIGFDDETARVTKLGGIVTQLQMLVKQLGGDPNGAVEALADAQTQLGKAQSALAGFNLSSLLAISLPIVNWPAGELTPWISAVKTAHGDLKAADKDIHQALTDLGK
jgi:hypothetical protein